MTRPRSAALAELIVDIRPGFASGEEDAGGVFQIRMNNITRSGALDLTKRRRVPRGHKAIPSTLLRAGDVLFNATNSPDLVGKTAIAPSFDEPTVFSNHFFRLRADEARLHPSYLARWLQYQFSLGVFRSMCRQWVNQASVGREVLLGLKVPLVGLREQQRIVGVLDRADALRVKRHEALACLDEMRQSLFVNMFGWSQAYVTPRSSNPNRSQFPWLPLTEVAQLRTGHTPDRKRSEYWDGNVYWINLNEIRDLDGRVARETEARITASGVANSSAVLLPEGTVCFSRTASIGFVTVMGLPMATSQDFVNWICGDNLHPIYLMHALIVSRAHLRALSDGSTHKTIYMRIAERFRILLPPFSLQREFASRVKLLDEQEANYRASRGGLDLLFESLQYRAFRGEL